MKTMGVESWRLFVQIAEHGSLTRVASARGVAQSVVSRQLATIERLCGGRLFERTGRGVRLSEAGARIYPRVMEWLEEGQQLTRDVRLSAEVLSGTVRIGVLASISHDFSCRLYQQVHELFPQVHLRFLDGAARQISEWLVNDAIDVGIVVRNGKEELRGDMPLVALNSSLIGPAGDELTSGSTVTFNQLDGIPLVIAGLPNVSRDLLEHMAHRQGIKISIAVECDSIPIQKQLVAQSRLYAILGFHAVHDELRAGTLQASTIVSPEILRSIVMRVPANRAPSAACRAVIDLAKAIVIPMMSA